MNLREVAKMMLDNKSIVSENDTIENLIVPILRDHFHNTAMVFAPKKDRWDVQIGETLESANNSPIACVECKSISHAMVLGQNFRNDEGDFVRWKPCGPAFQAYCKSLCLNESDADNVKGIGSAGGDDILQVWGYGVDKRYKTSFAKVIIWTNGIEWIRFKKPFFKSQPCMLIPKGKGVRESKDLSQYVVVSLRDGLKCQSEWDRLTGNLQREIFSCGDNA